MLQRSVDNINRDFVSWGFTAKPPSFSIFRNWNSRCRRKPIRICGRKRPERSVDHRFHIATIWEKMIRLYLTVPTTTVRARWHWSKWLQHWWRQKQWRRPAPFCFISRFFRGREGCSDQNRMWQIRYLLDMTVADLNIDMIGRIDENMREDTAYVYIIGSDFLSTELHHRINEAILQNYSLKLIIL